MFFPNNKLCNCFITDKFYIRNDLLKPLKEKWLKSTKYTEVYYQKPDQ